MQTRLFSTFAIAALALSASAAFAATRAETTTYVDGNLTGVSPNTGGTLMLSDDKAMYFRTGLSTVSVSYANVTHSELGAVKETSHGVPIYKVWARHSKTETQLLIVNFKNDEGEAKSMTLEIAKSSAPGVLASIQSHIPSEPAADKTPEKTTVASAEPVATPAAKPAKTVKDEPAKNDSKKADNMATGRPARPTDPWWGDDYWKTSRNADKWTQKSDRTELEKAPVNQR